MTQITLMKELGPQLVDLHRRIRPAPIRQFLNDFTVGTLVAHLPGTSPAEQVTDLPLDKFGLACRRTQSHHGFDKCPAIPKPIASEPF